MLHEAEAVGERLSAEAQEIAHRQPDVAPAEGVEVEEQEEQRLPERVQPPVAQRLRLQVRQARHLHAVVAEAADAVTLFRQRRQRTRVLRLLSTTRPSPS